MLFINFDNLCLENNILKDNNIENFEILKGTYIIHPILYKFISNITGEETLDSIIKHSAEIDKDNPYIGKGMIYFKEHFDEIINHYYDDTNEKHKEYMEYINDYKDCIFFKSIPIFKYKTIKNKKIKKEISKVQDVIIHIVNMINDNSQNQNELLYILQQDIFLRNDIIIDYYNTKYNNIDNCIV